MKNPLVLDIKCNSLDDGPGIRTTVFFKGCPLNCVWCHNPESKKTAAELSFSADDCIDCGRCRSICQNNALSRENPYYIDRNKCNLCFSCADVCPAKSLTRTGYEETIDSLLKKILSDKVFYDVSGGGVTLSGGEVTLFPEYIGDLLKKCKENGIHTLIETCGFFDYARFEKFMLPYIDAIYFDLKIYDAEAHKRFCGADNKIILENFKKLFDYSKKNQIYLLPRTPLIPDITDADGNLTALADFLKSMGVVESQLLPYNPTWYPKNAKLGMETPKVLASLTSWQPKEKIQHCKDIYLTRNIIV